jgi:hypothetical protein
MTRCNELALLGGIMIRSETLWLGNKEIGPLSFASELTFVFQGFTKLSICECETVAYKLIVCWILLESGLVNKCILYLHSWGTRWHSWLTHCATNRKVAGSISDGVTGIFYWRNPSGCDMDLRLTWPLTEKCSKENSRGKGDRYVGRQPYHLLVPIVLNSGCLNLLEPSCNGIALPLHVPTPRVFLRQLSFVAC